MKVGDLVVIVADGRTGRVLWTGIDGTCGCRSVVVRLGNREWWGKVSEVRLA